MPWTDDEMMPSLEGVEQEGESSVEPRCDNEYCTLDRDHLEGCVLERDDPWAEKTCEEPSADTWAEWERLRDAYRDAVARACNPTVTPSVDAAWYEMQPARSALDAFVRRLMNHYERGETSNAEARNSSV